MSKPIAPSTFARKVGLSKGRISQLMHEGLPVTSDGKIDLEAGQAWIRDNVDPDRSERSKEAGMSAHASTADGEAILGPGSEISLEPGSFVTLPPGQEIKFSDPPNVGDVPQFLKLIYCQIAAALSITYEDMCADLEGVNYSSFRGGALTARRHAEALRQTLLVEQFLNPIFERWLAIERLNGREWPDTRPTWIAPAWPMIDPTKETTADIAAIDACIKSRREVIEARGREFEAVKQEIENDDRNDIAA